MKVRRANTPATNSLLNYISSRGLSVGDRLPPIKDLSQQLKLAPHAVRDALLQAQTMGLIQVKPRSGCFVQSVNLAPLVEVFSRSLPRTLNEQDRNLFDLLEARRLIEVEMAGQAAARRRLAELVPLRQAMKAMYETLDDYQVYMAHNEAFHLGIATIAGNGVLRAILESLLVLLRPTLTLNQPSSWQDEFSRKRQTDTAEHEAIFEALLAGDVAAARTAMAAHLHDTTESLMPAAAPANGTTESAARMAE
jgi:GntR family transcriptional repressor for pyruvate dehydrogenase complex